MLVPANFKSNAAALLVHIEYQPILPCHCTDEGNTQLLCLYNDYNNNTTYNNLHHEWCLNEDTKLIENDVTCLRGELKGTATDS